MEKLEKAILCSLHTVKGLGHASLWKIKKEFGSFKAFWDADYKMVAGSFLSREVVDEIMMIKEKDPLRYFAYLNAQGINILTVEEEDYPFLLRNIPNPPYLLYYKGQVKLLTKFALAIVGARKATPYGKKIARSWARELSRQGVVVVSGMARGIDTEAHRGALEETGETVAVLGSGIDVIYPRENEEIFQRIIQQGVVISEFPLRTPPEPGNFPRRNRIISGLSYGVLVVEAGAKSGALITADFALEQGRDVFAVPGPVNASTSEGCNNLIKQGAKITTCVEDILEEYSGIYNVKAAASLKKDDFLLLDSEESLIIQCMGYEPCHIDELLAVSGMDIGKLSQVLLQMELKGLIKAMPGNYYVKN
ncbi:DNA processing protein [Thermosyntropha lipolytica DSM 11003]|uniref:DNA processing protein n=1 Tax=Thermosyntropha lipolytica DSM 11003 TaxID=1123382 RepID=A0A1M5L308_9FIRM|nr:DNA-processing protein DprA [Thermosyntropha lipolytica]SHG58803.1 DNA processing protein [Thermosyntropha lipolytica DSM 11003]